MTAESFFNYKVWIDQGIGIIANSFSNALQTNDPCVHEYRWKMKFLDMYYDFLCNWQLESYKENEDDYTYNCLKPSEAQCLSQFANNILGLNFCVDFYLTV